MQMLPRARRALSSTAAATRSNYLHFYRAQTRWNDNDQQGHINNAIYYAYMDDAINEHLLGHGIGVQYPRFVASSSCRYLVRYRTCGTHIARPCRTTVLTLAPPVSQRPLSYPAPVDLGLRVEKCASLAPLRTSSTVRSWRRADFARLWRTQDRHVVRHVPSRAGRAAEFELIVSSSGCGVFSRARTRTPALARTDA